MKTWHAGRNAAYVMVGAGLVVFGALAPSARVEAQANLQQQVTYSKDIAPIVQRTCQNCHRPNGGVAPMYFTSYEEVRPWAKAIKRRTAAREMPPWFVEKNVGIQHFKDDISLSDAEIALIGNWVDAGAPQGNPADMPPPRQFADANSWSIGTPDLIVRSPLQIVKAVGGDVHKPFIGSTPSGLTEDRWVAAFQVREFRPEEKILSKGRPGQGNDYFVLHHQGVTTTSEGEEESTERTRPRGEFSYTYEVGQNAQYIPEDVGVKIPADATIYFPRTHQHSIGKEVKFQVEVGFKFHPKGYTPKYPQGLSGLSNPRSGWGAELDIPGNSDNVRYDKFYALQKPVRMVTFEPHLHASGKRMCVEAIYPDGVIEMLNCSGYNHAWVKSYVYDDDYAPLLPTGTVVHFMALYDNSAKNPRVVDPRNWRGLGHRSIEDMFIDLSKYVTYSEEEFKEVVAAREAKKRQRLTTTARNNN